MQKFFPYLVTAFAIALAVLALHFLPLPIAIAVGAADAAGLWLVLTWYHADDEPLFGPSSQRRVTFKEVLAGAVADARELFERVTNGVAAALIGLDGVIASNHDLQVAVMASVWGLPLILALNLVVSMTPRRTS